MKKFYSESPVKNLETAMKDLQDLVEAMPQQLSAVKDLTEIKPAMPIKRCTVLEMRNGIDDYWRVGRNEHLDGEEPPHPKFMRSTMWSKPNWLDEKEIRGCVENAKWHLDAMKKHGEYLHTQNLPAIANNTMLRERLNKIMATIGIPKTQSVEDTKSRARTTKYKTVNSGWVTDMIKYITINDGYSDLQAQYNKLLKKIEDWEKVKMDVLKKAEAERIKSEEYQKAMAVISTLKVKHSMPLDSNCNEVIQYISQHPIVQVYQRLEDTLYDADMMVDESDIPDFRVMLSKIDLNREDVERFIDSIDGISADEAIRELKGLDLANGNRLLEYMSAVAAKNIIEKGM